MLFQRELRLHLKGFLICTAICVALSLYLIALIPSMGSDIQKLVDMKFPKQLQAAFGMQGLDYKQPMGIYGMMFSYLYLTFAIYAAGMFARIVSKEFSEKTAEYLFSLPAKRLHLIATKLGVATLYLTASILITFLFSWIGFLVLVKEEVNLLPLVLMTAAYWLGALFFGALAFMLSAYYIKGRMAVGIVLGAYLLQVVISLKEELHFLKYVSPFDWFKGSEIVNGNSLSAVCTCIAIALICVCGWMGIRKFNSKDVLV